MTSQLSNSMKGNKQNISYPMFLMTINLKYLKDCESKSSFEEEKCNEKNKWRIDIKNEFIALSKKCNELIQQKNQIFMTVNEIKCPKTRSLKKEINCSHHLKNV